MTRSIRRIFLSPRFEREIRRLPKRIQGLARRKDKIFRKNAFHPSLEPISKMHLGSNRRISARPLSRNSSYFQYESFLRLRPRDEIRSISPSKPFLRWVLETHKLGGELKDTWAYSVSKQYRVHFYFVDDHSVMYINIGTHEIYNK